MASRTFRRWIRVSVFWCLLSFLITLSAGVNGQGLVPDVFDRYSSVGQLGVIITNFGVMGNGYNKINGRILPSCQYKQHTEILREQVEHFSFAGLWVGGKVNGEPRVSTAIVDGVFESGQEGFEFSPTSGVDFRSSISSTSEDSMAQYYSPYAVSHQDILTDFKDFGLNPADNFGIPNHTSLGISVHLEAHAWNFTFADAFVILDYAITNESSETIHDLYAGIWADVSVANMNYTSEYEPGGGFTWYDNLDGYDQSVDPSGFTIMDLGRFSLPSDVAADEKQSLYVANTGAREIQVFNSDGSFFKKAGVTEITVDTTLKVFDGQDTVLVDTFLTLEKKGLLESPRAVAVDSRGIVYVCDTPKSRIVRYRLSNALDENITPDNN